MKKLKWKLGLGREIKDPVKSWENLCNEIVDLGEKYQRQDWFIDEARERIIRFISYWTGLQLDYCSDTIGIAEIIKKRYDVEIKKDRNFNIWVVNGLNPLNTGKAAGFYELPLDSENKELLSIANILSSK